MAEERVQPVATGRAATAARPGVNDTLEGLAAGPDHLVAAWARGLLGGVFASEATV
jgi:hypothetical protein